MTRGTPRKLQGNEKLLEKKEEVEWDQYIQIEEVSQVPQLIRDRTSDAQRINLAATKGKPPGHESRDTHMAGVIASMRTAA